MNVFVRAFTKSHIPGPHVRKSGCRLVNFCAQFCAVCISTLIRICLMLYDIVICNDVMSVLSWHEYERNITFTGVQILKSFLVYSVISSCKICLNFSRTYSSFMAGTDFGYWIFIITNQKFKDVFVRALIKSHVPRPYVRESGCKLENCHTTSSTILRCLRWHCKSFMFNAFDVISCNDVTFASSS